MIYRVLGVGYGPIVVPTGEFTCGCGGVDPCDDGLPHWDPETLAWVCGPLPSIANGSAIDFGFALNGSTDVTGDLATGTPGRLSASRWVGNSFIGSTTSSVFNTSRYIRVSAQHIQSVSGPTAATPFDITLDFRGATVTIPAGSTGNGGLIFGYAKCPIGSGVNYGRLNPASTQTPIYLTSSAPRSSYTGYLNAGASIRVFVQVMSYP